jgi:hypothetical protein
MPLLGASTEDRRAARLLSAADRAHFLDHGYLVLRQFATADEVAAVNRAVDRVWDDKSIYNPVTISAYAGTPQYTETYIRNVDGRARETGNKVNAASWATCSSGTPSSTTAVRPSTCPGRPGAA